MYLGDGSCRLRSCQGSCEAVEGTRKAETGSRTRLARAMGTPGSPIFSAWVGLYGYIPSYSTFCASVFLSWGFWRADLLRWALLLFPGKTTTGQAKAGGKFLGSGDTAEDKKWAGLGRWLIRWLWGSGALGWFCGWIAVEVHGPENGGGGRRNLLAPFLLRGRDRTGRRRRRLWLGLEPTQLECRKHLDLRFPWCQGAFVVEAIFSGHCFLSHGKTALRKTDTRG